jgi:hypothetical protein
MIIRKMHVCFAFAFWLVCALAAAAAAGPQAVDPAGTGKVYFAIEINGVVCGYSESSETMPQQDGRRLIHQDTSVFVMLSLLGSKFNSEIKVNAILDAETKKLLQADTRIDQGGSQLKFELKVAGNEATLFSSLRGEAKKLAITPGLVIGSDELFCKLHDAFIEKKATAASYDSLEILEEEIQKIDFKKSGEEKLELAGRTFQAMIVEGVNAKTGMKTKYWLAPDHDTFIQYEVSNRKVYLSDRRVVDRIKVSNMDAAFFTRADVSISDVTAIAYMKLQVKLEPTGVALSGADLNVPGQKFSGTVRENLVEGILEIEHAKYDGKNAPPFPPPFQNDSQLQKYLGPDRFIEANDPVLVKKALEITAGAPDSWQAAVRLSKWVAENIGYAIPGGGTARKTFDIRAGECGSHSMLLAAFCRAVGIPARVVFGAMYAPNFGGGFGQHGWNEIYMGPAGWIPVDATAFEIDFVDSGHIRITELKSAAANAFNGREIKVLDHRLANPGGAGSAEFASYLGTFSSLQGGRAFTVLEKEGNLALDVPQRMVLPFSREDGQGRWFCKIAPHLYLVFKKDGKGRAQEMALHQVAALPRKTQAQAAGPDIPVDLAPYTGNYYFAAVKADMTVLVQDGRLAVYDPTDKSTARFRPTGNGGEWIDDLGFVTISFDKEAQGQVSGMKIDMADTFVRGELASAIVEKAIAAEGLEAGLKKYPILKQAREAEVLFSEASFNRLGYQYVTAGKLTEAIAIFRLNVQEYPGSFNAYDSLAEAYMKNSQNEMAVANFKKSLQLNPKNDNARKMLEQLGVH